MTPTQQQALETIKQMKFRVEKQNRYDAQQTELKQQKDPRLALLLDEQLEHRCQQRLAQLEVFYQLLRESIDLSDYETGIYLGFVNASHAADIFNPTDAELDLMNAEQIITIGFAKQWRTYFPELSQQQAICLAITNGNPHVEALLHLRNVLTEQKQAA